MFMKFTATFSNGEIVKRESHNNYITAVGLINKETGVLKNVTFSTKTSPSPNWTGIISPVYRYGTNANQRSATRRCNEQIRAAWRTEIVEAICS